MKKIDLGQIISILANLGVIAGIAFLAFELQQNNELLRADARSTRVSLRLEEHWLPIRNPDLAQALIKHRERDNLSQYEQLLLDRAMEAQLVIFQNVYTEFQRGLIEEESIPIEAWATGFTQETLSMPGYWPNLREHWEATKFGFDSEFVQWMEQNVIPDNE